MKPTKTILKSLLLPLTLLMLPTYVISADKPERGTIVGGVAHQAPNWFKESFLEIAEDVDEATDEGRHVLLFFQLNGCPYCDRMLEESFEAENMSAFVQENFDSIAINVRGDREIVYNEDLSVTEKELSEILNVRATPAIVFLDENNKQVVRVNGYRAQERFRQILEYVSTKSYQTTSLADYLDAKLNKNVYSLRDNALFRNVTDLSSVKGPLMVIFEDGSCYDCNEFHDGILGDTRVQQEIKPYTVVRLDADSNQSIIDVDGNKTTAKEMARKNEMIYRPGVMVYNEGKLHRRHDSLTFPHHFKESLRFVAGGFYKTQDYSSYSENRTEELLSQGVTIDLGRPKTK